MSVFATRKCQKKKKKLVKLVNIEEENIHIFRGNFNEIFRENVSHDNIKSQRKQGLYPFCRKYSFEITIGDGHIYPQPF